MQKTKLIWDFRGGDALGIAKHYKIHLDEYVAKNDLDANSGVEEVTSMYCMAFLEVETDQAEGVKKSLRPHREEIV